MSKIALTPLKRITSGIAAVFLACGMLSTAFAGEVSRQPPSIYQKKLAALLTPLDEVLRAPVTVKETDTSGIPQNWFQYISSQVHHYHNLLYIQTEDALVRQDWPLLLSSANEGIEFFPTYYHFYWMKEAALYHMDMGRKQEAVAPLEVFIRYSKNEDEYPQALEWLKEVQPIAKQ